MVRTESFRITLARLLGVAGREPPTPSAIRYQAVGRTSMHAICVSAYRMHREGSSGMCVQCGQSAPCPARGFARTVIEAYADDPHRYDALDSGSVRLVAGVVMVRRREHN